MFYTDILAGMRVGPAHDVASSVDTGGARFEKCIHQNAAINCEAGLLGKSQARPHADPNYDEISFNHAAAFKCRALIFDSGHGIFEMKDNVVVLVQHTNEIAYFRPEDALHWSFFRSHHMHLEIASAQRCRYLKSNKARTDHERSARSLGGINNGPTIFKRTQHVNVRLVGARNRQPHRLRAGSQQKSIVTHLNAAGGDEMARFDINAGDLGIETQLDACVAVEAGWA